MVEVFKNKCVNELNLNVLYFASDENCGRINPRKVLRGSSGAKHGASLMIVLLGFCLSHFLDGSMHFDEGKSLLH